MAGVQFADSDALGLIWQQTGSTPTYENGYANPAAFLIYGEAAQNESAGCCRELRVNLLRISRQPSNLQSKRKQEDVCRRLKSALRQPIRSFTSLVIAKPTTRVGGLCAERPERSPAAITNSNSPRLLPKGARLGGRCRRGE